MSPPLESVHPAGQSAVPSVESLRSHVGVDAAVSVHPAGHAAVPSVEASKSHVWDVSVALPVQLAGISVAVPVQVSTACAV